MSANEKNVKANFFQKFTRNNSSEFTLLLVLVAFIILASILSPHFLTASNLANIGTSMSYIGVIAAGLTVVMLMGGIDLSQMSAMAISVMVVGIMVKQGSNPLLVILCAILVGAAAGLLNGFIIVVMRVMPMIATIGTQMIFRALAYITTNGKYMSFSNPVFDAIGYGNLLGVPIMMWIMLLVFIAIGFILHYTRYGREVYAIGSNKDASYLSGIRIRRIQAIGYTICGITSGIAGILWASQLGTAVSTAGEGSEMTPIAAVVIGGVSLSGGKGKIWGAFIGTALLSVFTNLMALMTVDAYYQKMLNGVVLILAVFIDILRSSKKNKI